jgi:proliferating cell nuclear antigen
MLSITRTSIVFDVQGGGRIQLSVSLADEATEKSIVALVDCPVSMTYALRYLNNFTKATPLAATLSISMSSDIPAVIEYAVGQMGYIRYYLAPKIED